MFLYICYILLYIRLRLRQLIPNNNDYKKIVKMALNIQLSNFPWISISLFMICPMKIPIVKRRFPINIRSLYIHTQLGKKKRDIHIHTGSASARRDVTEKARSTHICCCTRCSSMDICVTLRRISHISHTLHCQYYFNYSRK